MNEEELEAYLRDVCPCCGMYPPSPQRGPLEDHHFGVASVVQRMKVWVWILGGVFLLSLYMVIRNILGKQCLTDEEAKDPAKLSTNQYLLKGYKLCLKNWSTVHSLANYGLREDWVEAVLLITLFAFVTAGIKYGIYFSYRHTQQFLDQHHQASDWALRVSRVPGEREADIRKKIELIGDGSDLRIEVAKVIIPANLSTLVDLRTQLGQLNSALDKQTQATGNKLPQQQLVKLQETRSQIAKQQSEELTQIQTAPKENQSHMTAIVIFKTKEMAHRVYQYWNPDPPLSYVGQASQSRVPDDFYNIPVFRCEQPEHIHWLHPDSPGSYGLRALALALSIGSMIGGGVALYEFKKFCTRSLQGLTLSSDATMRAHLLSLATAVVALALYETSAALVSAVILRSKHSTKHQADASAKFVRLPLYLFFVVVFVTAAFRTTNTAPDVWALDGPLQDMWYLLWVQALLRPLCSLVSLRTFANKLRATWWRLRVSGKRAVGCDQKTFNEAAAGVEVDSAQLEVDLATQVMLGLSVVGLLPAAPLVSALGLLATILSYRLQLRCLSKQSPTRFGDFEYAKLAHLFIFASVPYGLVMWAITPRMIVLSDQTAFSCFLIMLSIPVGLLCLVSDLGVRSFLANRDLAAPWSRAGYADLDYADHEHKLPQNYEVEHFLSREEALARVETKIRTASDLTPLQKKALLTRLEIQTNLIRYREKEQRELATPQATDRLLNGAKSTTEMRASTNNQVSPAVFRKVAVVRPTPNSKVADGKTAAGQSPSIFQSQVAGQKPTPNRNNDDHDRVSPDFNVEEAVDL